MKKKHQNGKRGRSPDSTRDATERKSGAEPRDPDPVAGSEGALDEGLAPPQSAKEPEKASAECGPKDSAAAEPEFDEGMVEHIRMMTGLIEEREVSREETVEMLQRVMRQHSLGGERRIEYLLRYLDENPP